MCDIDVINVLGHFITVGLAQLFPVNYITFSCQHVMPGDIMTPSPAGLMGVSQINEY